MKILPGLALALLLALPAQAQAPIAIDVVNDSSAVTIIALNTFPMGDDGEPVEDNLGGLSEDVPPGGKARLELTSLLRCGKILAVMTLSDKTEGRVVMDLCADRVLRLHDQGLKP